MARGNKILKASGMCMLVFGILQVFCAIFYGFVNAEMIADTGQNTVTGLLVFFGITGIVTGFIVMSSGASAFRNAKRSGRHLKCIICGAISLALGIFSLITLLQISSMSDIKQGPFPEWICLVCMIAGGVVLPAAMTAGAVLSRLSYARS